MGHRTELADRIYHHFDVESTEVFPASSADRVRSRFLERLAQLMLRCLNPHDDAVHRGVVRQLLTFLRGDDCHDSPHSGVETSVALLRTMSANQITVVHDTLTVVAESTPSFFGEPAHPDAQWAISVMRWLVAEEQWYAQLSTVFTAEVRVPADEVIDPDALSYNREGTDTVRWLIDTIAGHTWSTMDVTKLESIVAGRSYYLLSPAAYCVLIPAIIASLRARVSVHTNGRFYINRLDIGDVLCYLNPYDQARFSALTPDQDAFIGSFLWLLKQLFIVIEDEAEVAEIVLNTHWHQVLRQPHHRSLGL